MKFRKKPVVIEAEQFFYSKRPRPEGVYVDQGLRKNEFEAYVVTLEGPLHVSDGDWIITDVKGERYPCQDEIFRLTYEPVDEAAP